MHWAEEQVEDKEMEKRERERDRLIRLEVPDSKIIPDLVLFLCSVLIFYVHFLGLVCMYAPSDRKLQALSISLCGDPACLDRG